jgi:hypothetical protein
MLDSDGTLNDERGVQVVAEEAGLHLHHQPRERAGTSSSTAAS